MRRYPSKESILAKIEEQIGEPISESMFNKDLASMKRIFSAPIKYHKQHEGYYYTEPEFSIKEFPLNREEIEALDFSTALLHQLKGSRIFQHFENAINKVIEGYRLSATLGKSEQQLIQVEEPLRSESSKWLEPILKAIVEKTCLSILYQGFGREEKQHYISPYLLKEYRNRWYMIGHSYKSDNVLVMALDRINGVEECSYPFKSSEFIPEDFFKYSFGITQLHDSKPEEVVLLFTQYQAPYILSQPLHHSQQIMANDEKGLKIKLHVYNTAELVMTILSYGEEVKVLEPESVVREICESIDKMKLLYK